MEPLDRDLVFVFLLRAARAYCRLRGPYLDPLRTLENQDALRAAEVALGRAAQRWCAAVTPHDPPADPAA